MPRFILAEKLAALDDAASCASSGAPHRDSRDDRGLRSTDGSGICHTYPSDGRGISPPKTLMTNFYNSDSAFCINRVSANAQRAWLSAGEVIHAFIAAHDWCPGALTESVNLRTRLSPPPEQMSLL